MLKTKIAAAPWRRFGECSAPLAVLLLIWAAPSSALDFSVAGMRGNADTTLGYATLIGTSRPDASLIGIANGGTARSVNGDDGRLAYARGDTVSSLIRLDESLQLDAGAFSLLARGSYFHDFRAAQAGHFGPQARDRLVDRFQLLDLFISGDFELADHHVNVRLGEQVLSWGEGTFIGGGLNVINALDLSRLRQPGSEIKDALLPTPALLVSFDLSSTLSFSGYALARFDRLILDPRGAYFATSDVLSEDGDRAVLGNGRRSDGHLPSQAPATDEVFITRSGDQRPEGIGQFGLALHKLLPDFGNAELGLYYLRYAAHAPIFSVTKQASATIGGASAGDGSAHYYADYPAGIDLLGVSLSTSLPAGVALQGEYSYRPNLPVQLPGTELVLAALNLPSEIAPDPSTIALGRDIRGARRVTAHHLQFSLSRAFAHPGLGSDQLLIIGEAGADALDLPAGLAFAGPGADLPSRPEQAVYANGSYQRDGFATRFSWGYRLLAQAQYLDVSHAVNLTPRLVWSHDVRGVGPNFNQGAQATTLGLRFDYLLRWRADIAYTVFFGGRHYSGTDTVPTPNQPLTYRGSANPLRDRDFVSLSLGYSF